MAKQITRTLLSIVIPLMSLLSIVSVTPALADGTTSVTITKYDTDGTTVLDQITIDYQSMEALLPVQGDGVTHQYLQGPVFEGDIWDPSETINIKDWGANRGTDLMDLCELVGGMFPDDTLEVKAADGFSKTYDYPNVYTPDPRQGKMVICWWCNGQYVPQWSDGMRLLFFAETTNPDSLYVFGNWDQHECFAPNRWYYYDGEYPTTTGHSVKYVDRINIYTAPEIEIEYDLTMAVDGGGSTSPSVGKHTYAEDTLVDITATPDSGWHFVNWTADVADADSASTTITMDADKTVTAHFAESNYRLTIKTKGEGNTTPTVGGHTYSADEEVDLEAIPDDGWEFVEWEGDVADNEDPTTRITMDDDKTVTARFEEGEYTLTIRIEGEGTTTPTAGRHAYGVDEAINLEAIPDDGWEFIGWQGDVADSDDATTTTVMDDDKTVTARFAEVVYQLTINISGQGNIIPEVGEHLYSENTMVSLSAVPEEGWQFDSWTGSVANPDSASTTVIMDGSKTVTANFTQETQNGVASSGDSGNTSKSGGTAGGLPWYLILSIVGAVTAVVILGVKVLRTKRY